MPTPSGHTTAVRAKTVIGTSVKDAQGEKIGVIEDIVLDKTSNAILFAVVGFGGVLGMGEKFHPIPWASLDYNEPDSAYIIHKTKDELKSAPADSIDVLTRDDGNQWRQSAHDYYGAPRNWS